MPKKFISGDWVKVRGKLNAPKMQVLKYISNKDSLLGLVNNDSFLECVWYKNGERKLEVFHQNKLIKTIRTSGVRSQRYLQSFAWYLVPINILLYF